MSATALIRKLREKGPAGALRAVHPIRLWDRVDGLRLRREIERGLSDLWCGRELSAAELRRAALEKLLRHARREVPYYRRLFDSAGVGEPTASDLARLPLLDKSLIRQHGDELLCSGWERHAHYRQTTGGTSGQPLEFVVGLLASEAATAHQAFAFRRMGHRDGDRVAAFAGLNPTESEREQNIYWVPREGGAELPYGSISYAAHLLNGRTAPFYFAHLDKAGYRFLLGYPSAVHAMARYCLDTGRRLSRPIAAVQLTSEIALDSQITDIEAAFGARVFLQYGHSEVCVYAHTTHAAREYLCSPWMGWVEVLDGRGRQVGPGEEGEIVVTGFHNRVMPFIRYRTGDFAEYGGDRDGIAVLPRLMGRAQEFLLGRDGAKVAVTGIVFGQHFKAFSRSERWQIFQKERGKITVRVIPRPDFSEEDRREIAERFRLAADIEARVELVPDLPRTDRGKHRFVVNEVGAES